MEKKFCVLIVMMIGIMVQMPLEKTFAQETPQYFASIMKTADGCPVSRLYATAMFVPIMIKEFHDPTPNWQVTSTSLTNNTKSLVAMSGEDKYAFLISTNSTDQFTFRTVASYTDGLEHQIYVEYWSQNKQIAIEQFSTAKGYFCRDFMVDTAVTPPTVDVGKLIQEAQAGKFQQLINAVLDAVVTVDDMNVLIPASMGVFIIILIIFLIYHRSGEHNVKEMMKKINFTSNEQNKNARELRMITQHLVLSEKARDENQRKSEDRVNFMIRGVNQYLTSWSDQFTLTFRNMLMESRIFSKEQVEKIKPVKIEPIVEEKTKSDEVIDLTEEDINPSVLKKEEAQNLWNESDAKKKILGIFKRRKPEVVIWSVEEWKKYYREKKYDRKKLVAIYTERTPYTQKNYTKDINAYNQYQALFDLAQEMDDKK